MTEDQGAAFSVAIRRIVTPDAEADAARSEFGAPSAVWRREDDALTGFGVAARLVFGGPSRFRDAAAAWQALVSRAAVDSEVTGASPIAFGTFAFSDESAAQSVLLVPRRILVARAGAAWRIDVPLLAVSAAPPPSPGPRRRSRRPRTSKR